LNFWLIFWELPRRTRDTYRQIEALPDGGDSPGVRRVSAELNIDPRVATTDTPDRLVTTLGRPLPRGDLGATPPGRELKVVRILVQGFDTPEPCRLGRTGPPAPSLVLRLRLRNLAPDYAFTPLDNYFDRKVDNPSNMPLTGVVTSRWRLYGGPAVWAP